MTGSYQVYVGDGKSLNIENIGSTTLCIPSTKMKLNYVLLVPELSRNLLFVAQLTRDHDRSIEFFLGVFASRIWLWGHPFSKVKLSKAFIQFDVMQNGIVWSKSIKDSLSLVVWPSIQ